MKDAAIHLKMLTDSVRLKHFQQSIEDEVGAEDIVVDIGAGLGVLSSYAKHAKKVIALEYFEETASAAHHLMRRDFPNIEVMNKSSFKADLTHERPTIVMTETIGYLGPDERIVEICADFRRRHPSIEKFIPSTLSLFAQPIILPVTVPNYQMMKTELCQNMSSYSEEKIHGSFHSELAHRLRFADLSRSVPHEDRECLVRYELGSCLQSNFQSTVLLPGDDQCDAIHLYFEAKLSDQVTLSTAFHSPMTHWEHCYALRPANASRFQISYSPLTNRYQIEWH